MTDLRPGWWMTGTAWLDLDGLHVWFAHDCTDLREATKLPWPTWSVQADGKVQPSIECKACGFHAVIEVGVPDEGHRCLAMYEPAGTRCERTIGHDPTRHRAGSTQWTQYGRSLP